jgi:hypothetical protein
VIPSGSMVSMPSSTSATERSSPPAGSGPPTGPPRPGRRPRTSLARARRPGPTGSSTW